MNTCWLFILAIWNTLMSESHSVSEVRLISSFPNIFNEKLFGISSILCAVSQIFYQIDHTWIQIFDHIYQKWLGGLCKNYPRVFS